jgi:hypothetical protein
MMFLLAHTIEGVVDVGVGFEMGYGQLKYSRTTHAFCLLSLCAVLSVQEEAIQVRVVAVAIVVKGRSCD